MNYQVVPIEKLKPDLDQPRKYFDEESIIGMADSINNEGVINAIEVDENFIIITGERRWRASKLAGLKEVPVKILAKITPKERFIRQVQENIHQNTMSAWDTAIAIDKIRKFILTSSAAELVRDSRHKGKRSQKGVLELHKLLGIPESTISEFLDLLTETGEMKKALQTPGFQRTKVATIKEAPQKYQKRLKHIVSTQQNIPRDTVRHIAGALRRADRYGEEDKAAELLNQNYEGLRNLEALSKINKIVPTEEARVKEPADAVKFIAERVIEFMELLDGHPLESFDDFHRPMIIRDLKALGFYLGNYLQGKNTKISKINKKLVESKK